MDEEIKFRMGLDAGPLAQGLRKAESMIVTSKDKIVEGFKDFSLETLGKIGLAGGAASVAMVALEKTLRFVEDINRTAESLGISTDFVQGLREAATISNFSADSLEKAMTKFAQALPAGSDVEAEFYKIADAIKSNEDPLTRIKIATEAFGEKLGAKMIPMLSRGADGLKQISDATFKVTEAELKSIEEGKDALESFGNRIVTFSAKAVSELAKVGSAFRESFRTGQNVGEILKERGEASGAQNAEEKANRDKARALAASAAEFDVIAKFKEKLEDIEIGRKDTTDAQRLRILKSRKDFEEHAVTISKSEKERYEHLTRVAEIEAKIGDIKKKQQDEEKEAAEKRRNLIKELGDAFEKQDRQRANLQESRRAFAFHTLEDLANVPSMGFGSIRGNLLPSGAIAARNILADQEAAHQAALWGNFGRADFLADRAARNFDVLAEHDPFLKNPFKKMQEDIANSTKDIETIRKKIVEFDSEE